LKKDQNFLKGFWSFLSYIIEMRGRGNMSKAIRRKEMLQRLNRLSKETYRARSESIIQRFVISRLFRQAEVIGVTISRFPEVRTMSLIEEAWRAGKRVVVPRCNTETKEMTFREIMSYDELEVVSSGLYEPKENETDAVEKQEIDLLIVPGVIYSNEGYRIGFGGGYYDRYLKDYDGRTVSLAFTEQTGQVVPVEPYDVPVQYIISDTQTITCQE